jgi:hypothetical protein
VLDAKAGHKAGEQITLKLEPLTGDAAKASPPDRVLVADETVRKPM